MEPPRAFRGRMDARFVDFVRSYCGSLAIDEDPAELLNTGTAIAKGFARMGKPDLGAVLQMDRDVVEDVVMTNGGMVEWVDTWEDLLGVRFEHVGDSKTKEKALLQRSKRKIEAYPDEASDNGGYGARMLLDGSLDSIKFSYNDFPELQCKTPWNSSITETDYHYICDVAHTKLLTERGIVSWDGTLREHVGSILEALFHKKPDRGKGPRKVLGCNRSFAESLKWRASNPRKTMNKQASLALPPSPHQCPCVHSSSSDTFCRARAPPALPTRDQVTTVRPHPSTVLCACSQVSVTN